MQIHLQAELLELVAVGYRIGLALETGYDNTADIESVTPEGIDQTEDIHIVGYAQVSPHLVLLYVAGIDGNHYLGLVLEFPEHLDLAVGLEAGQYPRGVIVVEQLSSEFEVKLAAEHIESFYDVLGLLLEIGIVVKTDFAHNSVLFIQAKI